MKLPPPLAAAARARPRHVALVTPAGAVDYQTLYARAARAASVLAARGHRPGDTLALVGTPDEAWAVAFHAIGLLGAVVAPIDATAAEPAIAEAVARHGAAARVDAAELSAAAAAAAPLPERDWPLDEVRVAVLTSGTTGEPRPVRLTVAQLVFSAMGSAARLGHHLDDRWLCCLPTHHVGGLSILLRTAWLATTCVLEPRFEARRVAELLDGGELSQVSLVPAMLTRVLAERPRRAFPPRLRTILLGGDRTPPALVDEARALGLPLVPTWGMSETASQLATYDPTALAAWTPGDAGPPLPFVRVAVEPSGALCAEGPVAPGGRLITADRGHLDDDGHVHVGGRRDLVFISGGENVDPERVEAVLRAHPAVADALVVGLPDTVLGQRTAAVLVPRPGVAPPPLADLRESLASRLARAERPSHIAWASALPAGPTGKPSRERTRVLLATQTMEDL